MSLKLLPVQYLSDTAPSINVIVSSGQTSHDVEYPLLWYVPRGQSAHGARPVDEYCPGAQYSETNVCILLIVNVDWFNGNNFQTPSSSKHPFVFICICVFVIFFLPLSIEIYKDIK